MALERVDLTPGYRRMCEHALGVKETGTCCAMCDRPLNRDIAFPHAVSRLVLDHKTPLESDNATPDSAWARIVVVSAPADMALGPRSKSEWEVRAIDDVANMQQLCDQCNNLKGARDFLRDLTTEEKAAVRAFHVAKYEKNMALYQGASGPALGDMPAALAAKYRRKAQKDYHASEEPKAD